MPDTAILDDPEARARLDAGGMAKAVRELPEQCREAWNEARRLELPPSYRQIERIVILGMGGSAIAGDVFRLLLARECPVPVLNHRHYDLPPYVDARTLLIACSFSGNTEETVSAFGQGLATPAKKLAITTGGRLLTTARANGVPTFVYRYEGEPRSAFGYGLMPLLAVAEALGLMEGAGRDVEEAISAMESLRERIGEDVPLAARLSGRLPVIYGAEVLTEVAHRWKTQINESSKAWAFYEELPEANHNAIVSYGLPPEAAHPPPLPPPAPPAGGGPPRLHRLSPEPGTPPAGGAPRRVQPADPGRGGHRARGGAGGGQERPGAGDDGGPDGGSSELLPGPAQRR